MNDRFNYYCLDKNSGFNKTTRENYERTCEDSLYWIQIKENFEGLSEILSREFKTDPHICESLTAEETRPRSYLKGNGILVILRGVNLNPGADPEDMVSIRIWIEPGKIISVQNRRIMAVEDIIESIEDNNGPCSAGEFLCEISERLSVRMSDPLGIIDDSIDDLEDKITQLKSEEVRSEISSLRRQVIALRRYLHPQRDALKNLLILKISWISEKEKMILRDVSDRITRYIEDLDSGRERTAVARDELDSKNREQMNKIMYVFSIITVVFLPLGLITGLLGINVGGIPGSENSYAFYFVCLCLGVILLIQLYILRKIKWI